MTLHRRPEMEILASCASPQPAARRSVAALISDDLDYPLLLKEASRHRLIPLVYHALKNVPSKQVPPNFTRELEQKYHQNVKHSLTLASQLLDTVELFRTTGISYVAFKGPTLSQQLYGNLVLRPCLDLDFLVSEQHLQKASGLLTQKGFELVTPLILREQRCFRRSICHYLFRHLQSKVEIELHWELFPRFFSSLRAGETDWDEIDVGGCKVKTFLPEILLILLCEHGTKHHWSRLIWVADIARLLTGENNIVWNRVLERARQTGSKTSLVIGTRLAQRLSPGASVSPQLPLGNSRRAAHLVERAARHLFGGSAGTSSILAYARFHVAAKDRLRDKVFYMTRFFSPNEKDWEWLQLPTSLFAAYYLLRPIRLLWGRFHKGKKEAD
ncbi:MAG: nucleotidyltransferase family protein [Acidobacteria bacterium]|nr:nucleotidyltransferase family protein [Acidobacteriota bacterium]